MTEPQSRRWIIEMRERGISDDDIVERTTQRIDDLEKDGIMLLAELLRDDLKLMGLI